MLKLHLAGPGQRLRVLCLGAHSDDIELGCAGTLLKWLDEGTALEVTWAVFSAPGERGVEARRSARRLLRRAQTLDVVLGELPDTRFPGEWLAAQSFIRSVATRCAPDVVLTHRPEDRHQDHRVVAELSYQAFRDHLVLEYEIAKTDADLGLPNLYVPLSRAQARRKTQHVLGAFSSQRSKSWFNEHALQSLMGLRGLECKASSGWAEAFHLRKGLL